MMWSKLKRNLIVLATLLLAMRFMSPSAVAYTPCEQTTSVRQSVNELLEFSSDQAPDVILQIKTKCELPKSDNLDSMDGAGYRCADQAKLTYSGGIIGSGNQLRAPPRRLWLIYRSLLL